MSVHRQSQGQLLSSFLTPHSLSMKPYAATIICDQETPISLYAKLAAKHTYAFLLESAEADRSFGRYSVIGFDPQELLIFPAGGTKNPLNILQEKCSSLRYESDASLPRIQAPFVGYFAYEAVRHFENLSLPLEGASIPDGIFFLPKRLAIFDHIERQLTLIAYSQPELQDFLAEVKGMETLANVPFFSFQPSKSENPTRPAPNEPFQELVFAAKEKIQAGEVFQIVLSQVFQKETALSPLDLYRRLRRISPSPYMYYLQYPEFSIIGSSPETLVRTEGDDIIIRPIAGTRRRGRNDEEDARLGEELLHDLKEQAEHMMLVDLGRNDVGRVAEPGTVRVTRCMELEKYSHVMHLVSEVRGKKREKQSLFDIFQAAFPAGTLTGAPKIRAISIIASLEKQPRGIYGGAVGYFDLSGTMDFAIAIRTMLYEKGKVTLRAGAGIVYDSLSAHEHLECHNKARAPLETMA